MGVKGEGMALKGEGMGLKGEGMGLKGVGWGYLFSGQSQLLRYTCCAKKKSVARCRKT